MSSRTDLYKKLLKQVAKETVGPQALETLGGAMRCFGAAAFGGKAADQRRGRRAKVMQAKPAGGKAGRSRA
jgi:hypothetical protein